MNFLPTMVLSKLAVNEGKEISLLEGVRMNMNSWTAKIGPRNIAEIELYRKMVREAISVHDFLVKIGAPHDFDKLLVGMLANMQISQEAVPEKTPRVREKLTGELQSDIDKMLSLP